MLKEHPEEEFDPRINIREYSFLDNPSVPKQVKESRIDVQLCQEGSQNCHVSNNTSPLGVLKFPKHSNEKCSKQFSPYSRMSKSFSSHQCKMHLLVSLTRRERTGSGIV